MTVRTRRAYEPPGPDDGHRYLVDRLWPRGVSAERLRVERWRKDLAPSEALCRWYGHDPARFPEFRRRYRTELLADPARWSGLCAEAADGPVTLVFGARDVVHSNAAVLAELLTERSGGRPSHPRRGADSPLVEAVRPRPRGSGRRPARRADRPGVTTPAKARRARARRRRT
ncbi:MAG TPA: DUF488 family protein [Thermoplasmata archaeon]|nr:DUF488 family protein [Thermoplasmata archaeon]